MFGRIRAWRQERRRKREEAEAREQQRLAQVAQQMKAEWREIRAPDGQGNMVWRWALVRSFSGTVRARRIQRGWFRERPSVVMIFDRLEGPLEVPVRFAQYAVMTEGDTYEVEFFSIDEGDTWAPLRTNQE